MKNHSLNHYFGFNEWYVMQVGTKNDGAVHFHREKRFDAKYCVATDAPSPDTPFPDAPFPANNLHDP